MSLNPGRFQPRLAQKRGALHARFDANLNTVGIKSDELDLPMKGIDGLADGVTISDAVKFASYAQRRHSLDPTWDSRIGRMITS